MIGLIKKNNVHLYKQHRVKKLAYIFLAALAVTACREEPDYSGPRSLELIRITECESRPHSILACPCNGDFYVMNTDLSTTSPSLKVDRYSRNGDYQETLIDFMTFDQGAFVRYIPRDMALDDAGRLYLLGSPVTDTSQGTWVTATGFSILEFDRQGSFIGEMDFSDLDGGMARILASHEENLYTCFMPEILRIDKQTGTATEIAFPDMPSGQDPYSYYFSDMEISPNGTVYFSGPYPIGMDSSTSRILTCDLDFGSFAEYISSDQRMVFASMIGSPGLAIHSQGDVYLSTFYGSGVEVYGSHMEYNLTHHLEKTGDRDPLPIDLATWKNRVYVADNMNSQVYIYSLGY